MPNQLIKQSLLSSLLLSIILLLTACNGFFDKDNTPSPSPLVTLDPEVRPAQLWSTRAGSGSDGEFLKMTPTIGERALYTTSIYGKVTAIDKETGGILWQIDTGIPASAGPGVGDGVVIAVSRRGDVVALNQQTGSLRWQTTLPGEILSNPAIRHGLVVVKATDGFVRALSTRDGHTVWSFQQTEPNLILRGSSSPLIRDQSAIVGFANGNLVKLHLATGDASWIKSIATPRGAFAIQRMIDIDANPMLFERHLYAATYQGNISALNWQSGSILWSHELSSYTGMTATNNTVFVTDAKSHIWSFKADNGMVNWRQSQLEARGITAPAAMNDYVVVGDAQGYLHWLAINDGHIAGRVRSDSAIYATPLVENNVLYAFTTNGYLTAYRLS